MLLSRLSSANLPHEQDFLRVFICVWRSWNHSQLGCSPGADCLARALLILDKDQRQVPNYTRPAFCPHWLFMYKFVSCRHLYRSCLSTSLHTMWSSLSICTQDDIRMYFKLSHTHQKLSCTRIHSAMSANRKSTLYDPESSVCSLHISHSVISLKPLPIGHTLC